MEQKIDGYQSCSAVRFGIDFFRFGARQIADTSGDLGDRVGKVRQGVGGMGWTPVASLILIKT